MQKYLVAFVDRLGKRAKRGADAFRSAQNIFCGNYEPLAEPQTDRPAMLERAGADFRALQIGDDGDWFFVVRGSAAYGGKMPRVLLRRPVGEIQARHIHPAAHQPVNHLGRGAAGSERANDLGPSIDHECYRAVTKSLMMP